MATRALTATVPPTPFAMPSSTKRTVPQPRPSNPSNLHARPAAGPLDRRGSSTSSTASSPHPQTILASSSKDTSSSSGTVFAKPSKEWVLPERAKPGRKVSVEEPDSSQNRLSQRAHRARKTDYIQTLEERLRQYEADEIHSNVRLQEVARALKADNERLKKETMALRLEISDLQAKRQSWDMDRAAYDDLVARMSAELKTLRGNEASSPQLLNLSHQRTSVQSSPAIATSLVAKSNRRAPMDCPICPDPDPDCPCQQGNSAVPPSALRPSAPLAALHLAVKAMADQEPVEVHDHSCGVCQTDDECLCRVIKEENDNPPSVPSPSTEVGFGGSVPDGCGLCTSSTFCACKASTTSSQSPNVAIVSSSTVIDTSRSTAAVPLRLGRSKNKLASIWALDPPASRPKEAECSGDPSNCDACRDDSFGKEFCSNLFEKAGKEVELKSCAKCPGDCMSIKSLLCAPAQTEDSRFGSQSSSAVNITPSSSRTGIAIAKNGETMTCDQAWKALKAHPNSRFASLSLLADVVAGRTVCTGPRDTSVPERSATSVKEAGRAGYPSASPLADSGRKRNMAVETSAVRDALRLLDNTAADENGVNGGPEVKKRRLNM